MMRRLLPLLLICLCVAADDAPPGEVSLALSHDRWQPAGMPAVVEATITNVGTTTVSWNCSGPGKFPIAQEFTVEVYDPKAEEFRPAKATNGQNTGGFGSTYVGIEPGESIVVPLAVAAPQGTDNLRVRVRLYNLKTAAAETRLDFSDQPWMAEQRRARVIRATVADDEPFYQHLAYQYPDPVVLDALLKLVTIDSPDIAAKAARTLARDDALPESAGGPLAAAVAQWAPRPYRLANGTMHTWLCMAALGTQSEPARAAVLRAMAEVTDAEARAAIIEEVRNAPGDGVWLRRARDAVAALPEPVDDAGKTVAAKKRALEHLDARLSGSM